MALSVFTRTVGATRQLRLRLPPSAPAAPRRAPAPPTLSERRDLTPEAEQRLMNTVRHFCERLDFAKTGITTAIHDPWKPGSPPMPRPIHAQAPRAGKFEESRGGKVDNALKGLEALQRNELEEEIPRAKDCLQTYVDQLFSYHVGHRVVYIERAKAKLRRDGASRTVYRWLHHRNVRHYITHHLDQSQ
ncbi:hypothetical protein PG985_008155 [Apiospora marii]|uniref:uncharacterized protein n=1 Tax=Apiospora marii TaxID=335849 RepID=UPI00312D834E